MMYTSELRPGDDTSHADDYNGPAGAIVGITNVGKRVLDWDEEENDLDADVYHVQWDNGQSTLHYEWERWHRIQYEVALRRMDNAKLLSEFTQEIFRRMAG